MGRNSVSYCLGKSDFNATKPNLYLSKLWNASEQCSETNLTHAFLLEVIISRVNVAAAQQLHLPQVCSCQHEHLTLARQSRTAPENYRKVVRGYFQSPL